MKLYNIVRPIARLAYGVWYRKIYYSGREKLPVGKPTIYSVNHPAGFFEPPLLGALFHEVDFHFLTRGDLFKKTLIRRIFESLNMIPIFRFRDGFSNLKNNASTMEYVNKALAESKAIMIFSEGSTKTCRQIRPIQKGLARMSFGCYDIYGDIDLQIVPIGLTFSEPQRHRSEVYIQIGAPIALRDYIETYKEASPKAINQLTTDVEIAMKKLIVEVDIPQNEPFVDRILEMYRLTFPEKVFPIYVQNQRRFNAQREIAANLNLMTDTERHSIEKALNQYDTNRKAKNIEDIAVIQPWHANIGNMLVLIIGFLPFLVGRIAHFLPAKFATKIRREQVDAFEFKGAVQAGVFLGTVLLYYPILLIIAFLLKVWILSLCALLVPFLGFYSLLYYEMWQKYKACNALKSISEHELLALRQEREAILNLVHRRNA